MYYVDVQLVFWKHHDYCYNLCWQLRNYNPWQLLVSNLSFFKTFHLLVVFKICILVLICYSYNCLVVRVYEKLQEVYEEPSPRPFKLNFYCNLIC
jgi:hypothetical protein